MLLKAASGSVLPPTSGNLEVVLGGHHVRAKMSLELLASLFIVLFSLRQYSLMQCNCCMLF